MTQLVPSSLKIGCNTLEARCSSHRREVTTNLWEVKRKKREAQERTGVWKDRDDGEGAKAK